MSRRELALRAPVAALAKMRVLVGVKRVIDYGAKVRVMADRTGVELANMKMSMNPFCEIAVEEAIRMKEKKLAAEVVVVSVGPAQCAETLRQALAMGADRAVHVATELRTDQELQPLATAKILAQVAAAQEADLVLLGKQSIDGDYAQTGPMLSALLGWPQATFAASVSVDGAGLTVERETDAGTETLALQTPAVVTADLRLNTPRYPKLPNIMKAKKKPIEALDAAALGVDLAPRNEVLSVDPPEARKAGVTVADVDQLVDKLRNEAGVV